MRKDRRSSHAVEPAIKVAVYGAGATGGYLGAKLALARVNTTLIARGPHLEAMRRNAVRLLTGGEELVAHPMCTENPREAGPQDFVIITLEAHSVPRSWMPCSRCSDPKPPW